MTRSSTHRASRVALVAALLLAVFGACSGEGEDAGNGELTILAASSLTEVFGDLAATFEDEHPGVEVTLSYGSSTDLAEQAADGAPGDVLATADPAAMRIATDAGVAADQRPFAANTLALVVPADNPAGIGALSDLTGTTWVRCADQAPCGRLALRVLRDDGVDAEPVSLEEDVRAALEKVTSGEADAALVYATDALAADAAVGRIGLTSDSSTTYLAAPLEQAASPVLAQEWVDLLVSERGRRVLADAGFASP